MKNIDLIKTTSEQMSLFADTSEEMKAFRPIHYLGSKLRILEFIKETIDDIDPTNSRVCDLFAGSGTVSQYLGKYRPVTAVDIQEYSRVITSAAILPLKANLQVEQVISQCMNSEHFKKLSWCLEPMIEYEKKSVEKAIIGDIFSLCELVEKGSIIAFEDKLSENSSTDLAVAMNETSIRLKKMEYIHGPEALVVRYFGGLYFSYEQSIQLDTLLEYASSFYKSDKDIIVAAILSTASEIVNTVGKQFAQPLKTFNSDGTPKKNIVSKVVKDRKINVFETFMKKLQGYISLEKSHFDHQIYKMDSSDALDNLKNGVKVVYADPPYTRYHYSRYYHVLETICLRDNPTISKTFINGQERLSRGVYREDRHQSPYSIKSKANEAFDNLFRKVKELDASLVLSYSPYDDTKKSTPRIQTIEELEYLGRKYFGSVELISAGQFSHSKLNKTNKNFDISYEAEILIVCKP